MNNFDFTPSIILIMAACVNRLFIPYLTGVFRNISIEIIRAFILCKTCQISEYKAWISMISLLLSARMTVLFPGETSIHYINARIQIFGLFWGFFWKMPQSIHSRKVLGLNPLWILACLCGFCPATRTSKFQKYAFWWFCECRGLYVSCPLVQDVLRL